MAGEQKGPSGGDAPADPKLQNAATGDPAAQTMAEGSANATQAHKKSAKKKSVDPVPTPSGMTFESSKNLFASRHKAAKNLFAKKREETQKALNDKLPEHSEQQDIRKV